MARIPDRLIAIAASRLVSGFEGQAHAGVTAAGTTVPIPAGAWGVQVIGTVEARFQIDGTDNPAIVPANSAPVWGLHPAAGSVHLATATGTANLALNWLLIDDTP